MSLQCGEAAYALDLPGHGHSDIPKAEYTEEFFKNSVETFLESFDINEATGVGESIGGVFALLLGGNKKFAGQTDHFHKPI